MTRHMWSRGAGAAVVLLAIGATRVHAVDYANIDVVDGAAPTNTTPPAGSIPAGQSTTSGANSEGFFIDAGSVVGEIPIRIGVSAANDAAGGVLMVTPRETVRFPADGPSVTLGLSATASTVTDDDVTSENTRNASGGLAIVTDRAGSNNVNAAYPNGGPMNANVAAAYFPFSQGWVGGTASASINNGAIDTFVGSAGFQLGDQQNPQPGDNVVPNFFRVPGEPFDPGNPAHVGDHLIKIPGVTDTRRQGILLATHAKNEDNHALVLATNGGDGFNLTTRDNAANGGDAESKPFSFVFVPLGTPNITMASMYGSAGPSLNPMPTISSGSNFSVTRVTSPALVNGNYRLTIDGENPSSGVLIVQGGGNHDGDGGNPGDNIVTYRPDGDGWIIVSDDLPTVNHEAGQAMDPLDRENYFHFVFMPFDAPPAGPAAIPALNWTKSSVLALDTTVTETDGTVNISATAVGMALAVNGGTPGVQYKALRQNRGDNAIHYDGALPAGTDGVMLATTSEGLRDNSVTGGPTSFGVATMSLTGDPGSWEVHTHSTLAGSNEEFNVNFATVLFGADSGFEMAAQAPTDALGNGHLDVTLTDVNSETDGVLMVNPNANAARFATVAAKAGGSGWDVDVKSTGLAVPGLSGTPPAPSTVNYVYLPYETENLIAGRVNADGTLNGPNTGIGTDSGEFTLSKDISTPGNYLLTIAGRTPDQGMLLLNAAAGSDSIADNTMMYEPDGNAFRIIGLDLVSSDEHNFGELVQLEDTAFSFAFIDYVTPPVAPGGGTFLEADFDQDGDVDGVDLAAWKGGFGAGTMKAEGDADADGDVDGRDFLTWQRQLGQSPPATVAVGAVPEPSALALAVGLIGCLAAIGRRKA